MGCSVGWWGVFLGFLCCFCVLGNEIRQEERPRLVSGEYQPRKSTMFGSDYEWIQTSLEFDQPMYLSESFLCPGSEEGCPPFEELGCVPCDFTNPESQECLNPNCCGIDQLRTPELWCPSLFPSALSPPPWITFGLNEKSKTFVIGPGEKVLGRFYIPEEYYCSPVLVAVRPQYGNFKFSLSASDLVLNASSITPSVKSEDNSLDFASTSILISPQWEYYKVGTYSFVVEANEEMAFEIEIQVSPEPLPFPTPSPENPPSISCADWDNLKAEMPSSSSSEIPSFFGPSIFEREICLEEGRTTPLINPSYAFFGAFQELILPVEEGCHTISLAIVSNDIYVDHNLYCLPVDPNSPIDQQNAIAARYNSRDDTLVFSACFSSPTFVHCGSQARFPGSSSVIFSTKAPVLRTLVSDVSPGALSLMMGLNALVPVRETPLTPVCGSYASNCWYSLIFAEEDPLAFWPPIEQESNMQQHYSPSLYTNLSDVYSDGRTVVFADFSLRIGSELLSLESQLAGTRLAIIGLTNEAGLPPLLFPRDSSAVSSRFSPYPSLFEFVSWISYEDLQRRTPMCSGENYREFQQYLGELVERVEKGSYEEALQLLHTIQTLSARMVLSDCVDTITETFSTKQSTIFRTGEGCLYQPETTEWYEDPCCNNALRSFQCCREQTVEIETTETIYSDDNLVVGSCRTSECAPSYVSDYIRAFNDQKDGVIGCPSLSPASIRNEMNQRYRQKLTAISYCLNYVGFGDSFTGVPCQSDADCLFSCNNITKLCSLPQLSEAEDLFIACFLESSPSAFEDYLKQTFEFLRPYPVSSQGFRELFKEIISQPDCVSPGNPLDISQRAKFLVFTPIDQGSFQGDQGIPSFGAGPPMPFGIGDTDPIPEFGTGPPMPFGIGDDTGGGGPPEFVPDFESEFLDVACEDQFCISSVFCRVPPECAFITMVTSFIDSSEEACLAANSEDFMREEGCGACLSEEEAWQGKCYEKTGVENEEACEELGGACRMLNGDIVEGLGQEECWEMEGECNIPCGDRPCTTREECEAAAHCSDAQYLNTPEQGGCFFAGSIISALNSVTPLSLNFGGFQTSPLAYLLPNIPKESCTREGVLSIDPTILSLLVSLPFSGVNNPNNYSLSFVWVDKAETEEECYDNENKKLGRYACDLPDAADQKKYLYNQEDCECLAGSYLPAWEWVEGVWTTPQYIPYRWVTPPKTVVDSTAEIEGGGNPYFWETALSFQLLDRLILGALRGFSVDIFLSAVTCQYNFTSAALDWVVCDCLEDNDDIDCTDVSEGAKVGQKRICKGFPATLIVPSAHLIFQEDSISEACLSVEAFLLFRDGYTYSIPNPAIALQFEDPRTFGAVVNDRLATVGSLAGDGVEIAFSDPTPPSSSSFSVLKSFELCLYNQGTDNTWRKEYTVPDFALFVDEGEMRVLYVDIEERDISGYSFWCTEIKDMEELVKKSKTDGSATFFPVYRQEDAKDEKIYSDQAITLAYVLAGCYWILFLAFSALLIRNLIYARTLLGVVVPALFLLLCIVRGIFFILWPQEQLVDEEVAEYILFETPTFLLMLLLLVFIHCWKSISLKQKKMSKYKNVPEIVLTIIIALLYFGILLAAILIVNKEEDGEESSCPGRVPADDSGLQDNLRILSITYMSIVTALTFFLGAMMIFESREIFMMMSKGFVGAIFYVPASRFTFVFLIFFLVRCTILLFGYIFEVSSDVFIFTVLLVCEVVPSGILWLEVAASSAKIIKETGTQSLPQTPTFTANSSRRASHLHY